MCGALRPPIGAPTAPSVPAPPHRSVGRPQPRTPPHTSMGRSDPQTPPHTFPSCPVETDGAQSPTTAHIPPGRPTHPAPHPHIPPHTSTGRSDPQSPPRTFPSCPIEADGAHSPTAAPQIALFSAPHIRGAAPTPPPHTWGSRSPSPHHAPPSPCAALHAPPLAPPLPLCRPAPSALLPRHFRRTVQPLPPSPPLVSPPTSAVRSAVATPLSLTTRRLPPFNPAFSGHTAPPASASQCRMTPRPLSPAHCGGGGRGL